MLFLAGVTHGYYEKEKLTWRLPPKAAMPEHGAGGIDAKRNGGSDFSKPPLHRRVEMCLLYDGFFSFAVVRQDVIQYSIQCFQ